MNAADPSLLLDHSAWSRLNRPELAAERRQEIAGLFERNNLIVSLPFLLEAGYSARDSRDHAALMEKLRKQPHAAIDAEVEARAVDAQAQLARAGHLRVPPVDVILAALAERGAAGILHYDRDFDLIRERTDLRFQSVWLAEPGTL